MKNVPGTLGVIVPLLLMTAGSIYVISNGRNRSSAPTVARPGGAKGCQAKAEF